MKKKKKFNYYNLFIYGFKFFLFIALIFFVLFCLGTGEFVPILKKYEMILCGLFMLNTVIMYIFIILIGKFEKKITAELEKPPKPFVYKIKKESSFSEIPKLLIKENASIRTDITENIPIHVYELHKWHYSTLHKYKMYIFIQLSCDEFTKDTVETIIRQREIIHEKLGRRNRCFYITVLVKVDKMSKFLKKHINRATPEDIQNYCMEAIFVKEENKIYVPKADWLNLEHFHIRKNFEKTLKNFVERERK